MRLRHPVTYSGKGLDRMVSLLIASLSFGVILMVVSDRGRVCVLYFNGAQLYRAIDD